MNTMFTDKTAKAVFLRFGIEDALNACKPFNATAKRSIDSFYATTLQKIAANYCNGNPYKSVTQASAGLRSFNIKNAKDLVDAILEVKDHLQEVPTMKNLIKIKTTKPKAIKYKSFSKKTSKGLDPERSVVVRSKNGEFPVLFYDNFVGIMSKDNKQLTNIKMDYHYATKCKYYDVRPILLSTWLSFPEDDVRRYCTCNTKKADPDDLTTF